MESMNVDVDKLPSERRMRELLTILVRWNRSGAAPAPILAIRHMGRAIGVHELTHLSPGCSAVMHAHIWQARYRGIGIGSVSYPAAMRIFFDRFALKCIRFETPIDNLSAQSVKRKLGIEPQGEGTIDMPMLRTPVKRSAIACCATNWKISRNSSTRSQVDRESRSTPLPPGSHCNPIRHEALHVVCSFIRNRPIQTTGGRCVYSRVVDYAG